VAVAGNDDGGPDYIMIEDLFQDMTNDDDGGGDGEEAIVTQPKDVQLFEGLFDHLDEDDVLFACLRWLENFREMKQTIVDPLYKDSPKECTVLRFNLQLLMLKAWQGWSDTRFNELLSLLATTYPTPNKVPANIYRAKKLTRPVVMRLRKFDAYPNHCILY
jgi:hypothetical protein